MKFARGGESPALQTGNAKKMDVAILFKVLLRARANDASPHHLNKIRVPGLSINTGSGLILNRGS